MLGGKNIFFKKDLVRLVLVCLLAAASAIGVLTSFATAQTLGAGMGVFPSVPKRNPFHSGAALPPGESAEVIVRDGKTTFTPSALKASGGGVHRVEAGQTVYAVSRLYNLPIRTIIERNNLVPPYILRVGQGIILPKQYTYKVQPGNTLYSISRALEVDLSELARVNRLTPPYNLPVGKLLIVPEGSANPAVRENVSAPPIPQNPVTQQSITPIPADKKIVLEDAYPPVPLRRPDTFGVSGVDRSVDLKVQQSASTSLAPPAKSETASLVIPSPPKRTQSGFAWPVSGTVLAGFGPQKDGSHNDGINIAAQGGTAVRAAENGVIVYAGNSLKGFGNMLLIRHDGTWVTAYAHTSEMLVTRGQTVTKGQVIARVGSSGNVATPQLHFELREGVRAVDPIQHLTP